MLMLAYALFALVTVIVVSLSFVPGTPMYEHREGFALMLIFLAVIVAWAELWPHKTGGRHE